MKPRTRKLHWYFILPISICLAACSHNKQLSKAELRLAAGDLRTFAGAAQFLAAEASKDHLTNIFITRQADLLRIKLADASSALDPPAGAFEQQRLDTVAIASQLKAHLDAMSNGQVVTGDASAFQSLSLQAKQIEDGLKDR